LRKTNDALDILDRLTGDGQELRDLIAQETINAQVAQLIYDARSEAGLTEQQLADVAGTKQPNIARLEDADYDGHS
jgi:ribosome-binding protein aMBF1 (putative translation factor)